MRAAAAVALSDGLGAGKFVKADELIQARFDSDSGLGLTAEKALNLMIAKAAGEAWKPVAHRITRGELRAIHHMTNRDIEALLDELSAVRFKIVGTSKRGRRLLRRRPLFLFIDEEQSERDDDLIEFEFDGLVRSMLARSEHYTVLWRRTMLSFDSKYALRLYELGARQVRIGKATELSVEELRELLGVKEGTFKGWNDFRRFVLDLAFTECNQVADFIGSWKVAKKFGRIVQRVSLAFVEKDSDGKTQAARDREAHRVVRRARRKGTEQIVE